MTGYPTLKFFPKGNKAGEDYHGERELDDFVSFINEKCGTSRDAKGQLTSKVSIVYILLHHVCLSVGGKWFFPSFLHRLVFCQAWTHW